jgi:anthranilate phosphoribosyltransferase
MEDEIRNFGSKVNELIKGRDLSREEAREMFQQVLLDRQPDTQQGAFLAAITAKGATPAEIAGSWEAIYELDTVKVSPLVDSDLVENCGTGMDGMQTFNISTAASLIAAADGVRMAKHGARAITSKCGTVDILEMLGVDVECEVDVVRRSIENAGIGIFNGMSSNVHPEGLGRILSKIRFGTILNIAGSLANPALPKYAVRGVYSESMVLPTAETMREIGYRRAVVVHGRSADGTDGMDEVSPSGVTHVAELKEDGSICAYRLTPEYFGLEPMDEGSLAPHDDRYKEALEFLRVIMGHEGGVRENAVCMNAAPILYVAGKVEDIREGFLRSKELLRNGAALDKLNDWVGEQNSDPERGQAQLGELIRSLSA